MHEDVAATAQLGPFLSGFLPDEQFGSRAHAYAEWHGQGA